MSSNIIVVTPNELSFDEYAAMQRTAFEDLFREMGVSGDFVTPEFFRWKYTTPYGHAKIILGTRDNEILAATMIYPHLLKSGDTVFTAWQNGDTATVPEARKMGLYPRCMKKAVAEVEENQLLFGFPNKNSIRGFSFFVKHSKGLIPLWAQPGFFRALPISKNVVPLHRFTDLTTDISTLYEDKRAYFVKTNAYLDWRYTDHPVHEYARYAWLDSAGRPEGYIVARNTTIQHREVTVVMELVGKTFKIQRNLIRALISRKPSFRFLLMFSTVQQFKTALQIGFMQIPPKIVPKQQFLYATAKGEAAQGILEQEWAIQMGDWDGF